MDIKVFIDRLNSCIMILMFYIVHVYNLEALIDTVWHKKPSLKEVKRLLRDKSEKWDEIGRELDVPLTTLEEIHKDSTLIAGGHLERVLHYWLQIREETGTWKKFRKHLINLDYLDILQNVDIFLLQAAQEIDQTNHNGMGFTIEFLTVLLQLLFL